MKRRSAFTSTASLKEAARTFKAMGETIKQNTPGPEALWQGFLETHVYSPALPFLIGIALLLLFGEPLAFAALT